MVQVHSCLFFQRFYLSGISCAEIPRHHFLGVRVVSKGILLRSFLGTDNPFNVSSMICVSKMVCSIELSTSVSGIIFVSTKHRIKSKIKRSSLRELFDSQTLTISLHDMFALQTLVQTDGEDKGVIVYRSNFIVSNSVTS